MNDRLYCKLSLLTDRDRQDLYEFVMGAVGKDYYTRPDKEGRYWYDDQRFALSKLINLGFITETKSNEKYTSEYHNYSTGERGKEIKHKYYYKLTYDGECMVNIMGIIGCGY